MCVQAVRAGLIDVVLATDMSKHFLHVNKFRSVPSENRVSGSYVPRDNYLVTRDTCVGQVAAR